MNELVAIFKALSDETRLRTLKLLQDGELCVCDIVAGLGMPQPKVSFHLRILRDSGMIKDRKEGKWIYYRIADSSMFERFLILSIMEKISAKEGMADSRRLHKFRKNKEARCR